MPTTALTADEERWIRATRLTSLLLSAPGTRTVADVVGWFGAMQGQDLGSVTWSLGLRTGQTRDEVAVAFQSGAILRTWPMRGTLHVVPGRDARWMIEHLGARALAGGAARRQHLGLAERDADRATDVLGEALVGGQAMTRAECVERFEAAGVPSAGQRAYHLLWYASQRGVTCVGPNRGKEQTFVLLDEFAPAGPGLDRPAALATIAERFVRSHGPVSAHDLARWADLTVRDARAGLASAAADTITVSIGGREMHVLESQLDQAGGPAGSPGEAPRASARVPESAPDLPTLALPGFDEYVLGYRDRSAQLDPGHERLVVPGGNGVFANTLVLDGRVVGTWRRRELTRTVDITATPFTRVSVSDRTRLASAFERLGDFVGRPARVTWSAKAPAA